MRTAIKTPHGIAVEAAAILTQIAGPGHVMPPAVYFNHLPYDFLFSLYPLHIQPALYIMQSYENLYIRH